MDGSSTQNIGNVNQIKVQVKEEMPTQEVVVTNSSSDTIKEENLLTNKDLGDVNVPLFPVSEDLEGKTGTFLITWSTNYINPNIFALLNSSIKFVVFPVLSRNKVKTLLDSAYESDYHFVERCVIINSSTERSILPWTHFIILRKGEMVRTNVNYAKYEWNYKEIVHQANKDIVIAEDMSMALEKMFKIMTAMLPKLTGQIIHNDSLNQLPQFDDVVADHINIQHLMLRCNNVEITQSKNEKKEKVPDNVTDLEEVSLSDDSNDSDAIGSKSESEDESSIMSDYDNEESSSSSDISALNLAGFIKKEKKLSLNDVEVNNRKNARVIHDTPFNNYLLCSVSGLAKLHYDLNDQEVLNLKKDIQHPTITFSSTDGNSYDYVPESEVGYGENVVHVEDENQRFEKDKTEICDLINKKCDLIAERFKDHPKVGLSNVERLRTLLLLHWEAFGTKNSKTQVSLLKPIRARLKSNAPDVIRANPIKPKGLPQQEFMVEKVQQLLDNGLIKACPYPRYSSAAFPVLKPHQNKNATKKFYRMVIDMRLFNDACVKTILELPNLEEQFLHLQKPTFFAVLDILSGFDYLPTHEEMWDLFCFTTTFGIFSFIGAPQGWLNTPAYFSNRVLQEILLPAGLLGNKATTYKRKVLQWIDDTLLFADDFDSFYDGFEKLLIGYKSKRVRLNIEKCQLFRTEVEFCGRVVNNEGWRFPKRFFTKILGTSRPVYHHELAQAVFVVNWLSSAIPNLSQLRKPFSSFTNLKGKKLSLLKKQMKMINWTPLLIQQWKDLLKAVACSAEQNLSHYDRHSELGIFIDASQENWALVLGSINFDSNIPFSVRSSEFRPMLFLSGKFISSQLNWTMSQKELFPIIKSFERIKFLLEGHVGAIHLFTDHKNLIPILRPLWVEKTSYFSRLRRWSLVFQHLDLQVQHISSSQNSFADMLTRWATISPEAEKAIAKVSAFHILINRLGQRKRKLMNVKDRNLSDEDSKRRISRMMEKLHSLRLSFIHPWFKSTWWTPPNKDKLIEEQYLWYNALTNESQLSLHFCSQLNEKGLYNVVKDKFKKLVPPSYVEIMLFWIHVSVSHDSATSEYSYTENYYFDLPPEVNLKEIIDQIRHNCLHCRRVPSLIPRPYSVTDIAKAPRDIIHADYLYINKQMGYILVLLDNFSRKVMLKYCAQAKAFNMAQALLEWRGRFNFAPSFLLVTDNGSHFSNMLLRSLRRAFRYRQKFTVANAPFTNGSIETVNTTLLTHLKQLCSEFRLPEEEWPLLLPNLEYILNNKKMKRRKNFTANQLFLGVKHEEKLHLEESHDISKYSIIDADDEVHAVQDTVNLFNLVDEIQSIIQDKVDKVYDYRVITRELENKNLNKKRFIFQFHIGDWVMYSRKGTPKEGSKLHMHWIGPYQVINTIADNVYQIRSPLGKEREVHSSRLWFYAEEDEFHITEDLIKMFEDSVKYFDVKEILTHKIENGHLKLCIWWKGFLKSESTWEDYNDLAPAIPQLLTRYFKEAKLSGDEKKIYRYLRKQPLKFEVRKVRFQEKDETINLLLEEGQLKNDEVKAVLVNKAKKENKFDAMIKAYMDKNEKVLSQREGILVTHNRKGLGMEKLQPVKEVESVDFQLKMNRIRSLCPKILPGWSEEEENIFCLCMLKYGCGQYHNILKKNHLIGKNKQQMYNKLKKLLNLDAIKPWTGVHLDPRTVNFTKEEKTRYLEASFDGQVRIAQSYEEQEDNYKKVLIPYYRSWLEPSHRLVIKQDLSSGIEVPADILEQYKKEDKKWNERVHLVKELCYKGVHFFKNLSLQKRKAFIMEIKTIECNIPFNLTTGHFDHVKTFKHYVLCLKEKRVHIEETNNNLFQCYSEADKEILFEFFLQPKKSIWLKKNVMEYNPNVKVDILYLDPPWPLNGPNPIRGPALQYSSLKLTDITSLDLTKFQEKGLLAVWNINKSYRSVLSWLESHDYHVVHEFFWCKITKNGKFSTSVGHYLQHATESCIIAKKGTLKVSYKNINSHIIWSQRRVQSQKPDILYNLLDEKYHKDKDEMLTRLELFGRFLNLRSKWKTVGYQVLPKEEDCWIFLNQENDANEMSGSIVL